MLALLYSLFLILYVLVIVARFLAATLGGVGILLLAVVVFFTLRPALAGLGRGMTEHVSHMRELIKRPKRLAVHILVAVAVLVLVCAVPFPHRVSGEVTVQSLEEFTLLFSR